MTRLWRYSRAYLPRWAWGSLMLLLTNGATMAIPQLFRFAVDGIRDRVPLAELRTMAVTLVVVATGAAVFRVLSRIHVFYAGRDVEMDIRLDFYRHLSRQPPSFFLEQSTGDLMSRGTADLTQVRLMLGPGFLNIVNTLFAYATALPLMLMISPRLTLMSLACFPLAFLVMHHLGRLLYLRNRAARKDAGRVAKVIQENLSGAHVVRAFACEQRQRDLFEAANRAFYRSNTRLAWTRSGLFRLGLTVANIGILVGLFFGARDVLAQHLSIGELVALVEYMALLSWPTLALGWILAITQRGAAAMARITEIMEAPSQMVATGYRPQKLAPAISVRDLSLVINGRPVLDRVSCEIDAGTTVGIVGPIGSGKSLLLQCFLRLVDVAPQRVFLGGHDITSIDLDALREMFGYVPQDHVLFSKPLADNVAFGRPDASASQILESLRRAGFTDDLKNLPMGLNTPIGERGLTLSGGQKQRVSIARAMLIDPPILVLDDALSSLDAETEANILTQLRRNRKDQTNVIVSHRVSAVQHADHILVLEGGQITARGQHETLTRQPGFYAQLVKRQQFARELAGTNVAPAGKLPSFGKQP